jgi:hypothetical protein
MLSCADAAIPPSSADLTAVMLANWLARQAACVRLWRDRVLEAAGPEEALAVLDAHARFLDEAASVAAWATCRAD